MKYALIALSTTIDYADTPSHALVKLEAFHTDKLETLTNSLAELRKDHELPSIYSMEVANNLPYVFLDGSLEDGFELKKYEDYCHRLKDSSIRISETDHVFCVVNSNNAADEVFGDFPDKADFIELTDLNREYFSDPENSPLLMLGEIKAAA
jgi:hypothetical protein